jgi:molybdenum cofactor cytidylyltransferase
MKFGPVPVSQAVGAILAHGDAQSGLKKGRLLTAEDVATLREAGHATVVVAQIEDTDMAEDDAARCVAQSLAGAHIRLSEAATGRVNLYAAEPGVVRIDAGAVDALNALDESITAATVADFEPARAGAMLATIKIIPYAAPKWAVAQAQEILSGRPAVSVRPFQRKAVALISTETPGFKRSLLDKNRQVTENRIAALGSALSSHAIAPHTIDGVKHSLKSADADLILIFGATANSDRQDVIPAAIVAAGGTVAHIGMPVDPGNLLVLGEIGRKPVIGLPGCARSPKRNGFDFVLERLCADIPVGARDVMGMGVGGLLKEIPLRGHPREAQKRSEAPHKIAAVVLAAGRSTRMGANKLLATISDASVLAHTLRVAQDLKPSALVVVTGHERERVLQLLPPGVTEVYNPDFPLGMASSLKAGLVKVPGDADAVLVMLADMPAVRSQDVARLIAAFDPENGAGIVVPVHEGKRGHPVLFARDYWPSIMAAEGDQGARQTVVDNAEAVCEVRIDHPGVLYDADTPEALAALRRLMET